MNLWDKLFTTQISEPPSLNFTGTLVCYVYWLLLFMLLIVFDKVAYQRFIQILQSVQLIVLYSWYWGISCLCQKVCPSIIAVSPCL